MEYNTQREPLILKEYGRNVQNLVRYMAQIDDEQKRKQAALTLIYLMKQLNPTFRDNNESERRVWDHLHLMADLNLDVDSPFAPPEKGMTKKPKQLEYRKSEVSHKHYGRNIELLINHAVTIEDREAQLNAIAYIGKLMKSFYSTWNNDNVSDKVIINDILKISNNQLELTIEEVEEKKLFEGMNYSDKKSNNAYRKNHHKNDKRKHNPKHRKRNSR